MASSLVQLLFSLLLLLLATSFVNVLSSKISRKSSTYMEPFKCYSKIISCNASLYHISYGLNIDEIASFYSVSPSQIKPIMRGTKQDYLITVPCSCKNTIDLSGYFYDTTYKVKPNDKFLDIKTMIYSGQAWSINSVLVSNKNLVIHIPCGCSKSDSQIVVTYTVQWSDTPTSITNLLNATLDGLISMNQVLNQNPSFIDIGWVIFVPRELNGLPQSKGKG
ncbi:putative LysM domain-containing protein [Lupinus albus]|uniref:Putative LysM domain-containing protein n=1 Tax=Lupinus albus TaxID=3870 RepID=A0A6A4NX59_LUPAL|nr:putative LysM domain-containing protein [Lupinus albus]